MLRLTNGTRRHRNELRLLVGRKAKSSSRKKRKRPHERLAKRDRSQAVLAAYVEDPLKLRADHKGTTVRATVRRDGWISYDGGLYWSPSAAAQAVVGRSCNGWIKCNSRTSTRRTEYAAGAAWDSYRIVGFPT